MALAKMRIEDLSENEFDGIMRQVDVDGDGSIRYKEFLRKLQRHGVRNQTSEEQIIYLLMAALRRSRKINSLVGFFELMDKKASGYVDREDFLGLFRALQLNIPQEKVEQFMEHFWKDKAAAIDYKEFIRIFQKYQVQLDEEGSSSKKSNRADPALIRHKKQIFDRVHKALSA